MPALLGICRVTRSWGHYYGVVKDDLKYYVSLICCQCMNNQVWPTWWQSEKGKVKCCKNRKNFNMKIICILWQRYIYNSGEKQYAKKKEYITMKFLTI